MTYTVCFLSTGGIDIEAEDADEALRKFANLDPQDVLDTFAMNGWEITEIEEREE